MADLRLDLTDLNLIKGEKDLKKWSEKYGQFISDSRRRVKEEDICLFQHGFHVLPKDDRLELIPVVLRAQIAEELQEITVFLRRINLYVVGFRNLQGNVFKFKNVRDVLYDAVAMDIEDNYADMTRKLSEGGVYQSRDRLPYGPRPLSYAIINLSHTNGWDGIVDSKRAKSLLAIILMIPEALRFPSCSCAITRLNDHQIRCIDPNNVDPNKTQSPQRIGTSPPEILPLDPVVFKIQTAWRNRSDSVHNLSCEIKNAKRRIGGINEVNKKRWLETVKKLRKEVRVILAPCPYRR